MTSATPQHARDPAPDPRGDDLRGRLAACLRRARVPGLAAVVARRGEPPCCAAVGLADPRTGERVSVDTVFAWYSLTKIVTAAATMRLVERGALSLATALDELLPEAAAAFPRGGRTPTVAELLSHGGGLGDRQLEVARWFREPGEALPPDDAAALRWLAEQTRAPRPPGRRLRYSNLGYALLGGGLSRATGVPFRQLVAELVLAPLGCATTGFEAQGLPAASRALGLLPRWSRLGLAVRCWGGGRFTAGRHGAQDVVRWRDLVQAPHGGLLGPVTDLARLLDAFVQDRGTLVSPRSAAAMGRMQRRAGRWLGRRRGCGLGWFVDEVPRALEGRGVLLSHGGLGPGFTTELAWLPEAGVGVGVLGNGGFDAKAVARELLRPG